MILVVSLTICYSSFALAAIHSNEGEFYVTDSFFTVEPNDSYAQIGIDALNYDDYYYDYYGIERRYFFAYEYYKNDQTFFRMEADKLVDYINYALAGSYRFNSGFFIGAIHQNYDFYDDLGSFYYFDKEVTIVSPGYCLTFDEYSYLALSVDYMFTEIEDDIYGYDLDFRCYQDYFKILGNAYKVKEGDTTWGFSTAFKATDQLTVGFDLANDGDDLDSTAGVTFKISSLVLDCLFNEDIDDKRTSILNGMYYFQDDVGIGLRVINDEDAEELSYGILYSCKQRDCKFKIIYFPETDYFCEEVVCAIYLSL